MAARCSPGAGGRKIIPAALSPLRVGTLVLLAAIAGAAPAQPGRLSVGELLSGPASGFATAREPREFSFPADHGPHPDYRVEWWYFTGNLRSAAGRELGFQLTFFRFGLVPAGTLPAGSAWTATDAWMAHFALSDPMHGRLFARERFARGALGLAGAEASPLRVWLHDWRLEGAPGATFPLRLSAHEDGVSLDLALDTERAVVLQGERGLSRKSETPGNASYYYSFTRLAASGTVRTPDGEQHTVQGSAWWDREWSTSALEEGQAGWDWFALQLDDGEDLMFYQLRLDDGGAHPSSAGSIAGPDGVVTRLTADDVELEPLEWFDSPRSGVRYPVRWRLRVPSRAIELEVEPLMGDQEVELSVRYWEGAVRARGSSGGRIVRGVGYLELAGYGAGDAAQGVR